MFWDQSCIQKVFRKENNRVLGGVKLSPFTEGGDICSDSGNILRTTESVMRYLSGIAFLVGGESE